MSPSGHGDPARRRPPVFAHRGSSAHAPQNTMAAFDRAARSAAAGIEIDVQRTRDGEVVVIHDDTVDRTTDGRGALADLTLDEVRALDAGSWFGPGFRGQRVPTWEEFLGFAAREAGLQILLEVKGEWAQDEIARLLAPLAPGGAFGAVADRVIVQSFWPESVARSRSAAPGLRRGLLLLDTSAWDPSAEASLTPAQRAEALRGPLSFSSLDEAIATAVELDVTMINPMGTFLTSAPELMEEIHAVGRQAMVWTLNDAVGWAAASAAGADGIISDDPEGYLRWAHAG